MTAAAMQQPPVIPPRPAKGQDNNESAADVPKIPPRPSKRSDRSISPNPARFAPSPFNEGIPKKSPISARFNPGDAQQEPIKRPTSVSMPSIGQEGAEYSAVTHEIKPEEVQAPAQEEAASPEQTRTIAEDLKLHAPKPSLPAQSAKQRVQAVTRTDSDKAAQFGIGRPGSTQATKQSSTNVSVSDGRQEVDDDHGIPEIGQRVPMNPHLGDVQAPSPGPGSEEYKKHHHRKHSSRGGPPGSYGLHGHGVTPQDKLDKEYYEKHPEVLKREHQTPLHDRQNDFAMSKDDLNKLVRDTRSRGAGLSASGYQSTPTDEVGFQATEEYTSRLSPRPASTSEGKVQPISFKSEIISPEGEHTVHVDDPKHPEYRSYGDGDADVDEEHKYTAPILAEDEVKNDDHSYSQRPAVNPVHDRRDSGDLDEPLSRPLSRTNRPKSRPTSIYKNNDSQEFAPTSLDDVEEYEPLFPEDGNKDAQKPAPGNKARHHFPSKDIWEDAPESVHYTVEVSTPDPTGQAEPAEEEGESRRRPSAMDRPKTPAHLFAQRQEELAEQEANGPVDVQPPKSHDKSIWYESKESDSFLNDNKRPSIGQRFPSRDIWEDAPESQLYETTVDSPQPQVETKDEPKEEPKEQSKPAIPERPVRKASPDRPSIPERPKSRVANDDAKSKPPVSEKPKPSIPPRPTKSSSGDSVETKQKPPVPSRPAGSKIAALQAGFMSDLNKRLKLGPHVPPKKEEPKAEEDLTQEKEKVPLSDARKGRARGPQRRAPARSPAAVATTAPAQPTAPSLTFSIPQTFWSISPEGSLSVSGEQTPISEPVAEPTTEPVSEPVIESVPESVSAPEPVSVPEPEPASKEEPVEKKKEETVDAPAAPQEALPKSEPNLEPKPEIRGEPESESVPVHRDPEPVAGKLPQEAEPTLPAQQPAVEPSPEPAQEAPAQEVPDQEPQHEQEPVQVEKSLVANTAGETILETTVDKKEGGDVVEPVGVSDEVKQ
ncbi:hypothetical protein NXS19_013738 [Fusarium pseudograminearum]|uniref:Altered inheritance of mitochondria protein 21 n=1 Tax=Fusarium pseudograminearum (strain CS3096) TaxID=1028729 RepID=K3V6P9_FUSPC|nr:hypothetical protein FPSE_10741 [Fusarium pseudograminearum CS3096]EKJ69072.1 hypothetical protein FPSE_10741 [Fusarium pseudograminearum CS3096]KAF0640774.1 hypothetical protein FPSE5266_10741 [Fusarium pseudograminearum]UZP45926.1 hypothetical protein NXS19_013738 [Fusarium pseudograminearum]